MRDTALHVLRALWLESLANRHDLLETIALATNASTDAVEKWALSKEPKGLQKVSLIFALERMGHAIAEIEVLPIAVAMWGREVARNPAHFALGIEALHCRRQHGIDLLLRRIKPTDLELDVLTELNRSRAAA